MRDDDSLTSIPLWASSVGKTGDDLAEENATLYYKYGNALIKKYRSEANVFGNALQKRETTAAADEEEEEEEEDGDDDDDDQDGDTDGNKTLGKHPPQPVMCL